MTKASFTSLRRKSASWEERCLCRTDSCPKHKHQPPASPKTLNSEPPKPLAAVQVRVACHPPALARSLRSQTRSWRHLPRFSIGAGATYRGFLNIRYSCPGLDFWGASEPKWFCESRLYKPSTSLLKLEPPENISVILITRKAGV